MVDEREIFGLFISLLHAHALARSSSSLVLLIHRSSLRSSSLELTSLFSQRCARISNFTVTHTSLYAHVLQLHPYRSDKAKNVLLSARMLICSSHARSVQSVFLPSQHPIVHCVVQYHPVPKQRSSSPRSVLSMPSSAFHPSLQSALESSAVLYRQKKKQWPRKPWPDTDATGIQSLRS